MVQWLRIRLVIQGDTGSIPDWGRSHMTWGITSQPTWREDGSPLALEPGSATRDAAAIRSPCAAAGNQPPLAATRESSAGLKINKTNK